jgi:hypothetical protein
MKLYLVIVLNSHPDVMHKYKYLIRAESKEQTVALIQSGIDGKWEDTDSIESVELVHSLDANAWYLPEYSPKRLEPAKK